MVGRTLSAKTCVLCKKKYNGFGNNAQPLAKGLCCDDCNVNRVIPARLGLFETRTALEHDRIIREVLDGVIKDKFKVEENEI